MPLYPRRSMPPSRRFRETALLTPAGFFVWKQSFSKRLGPTVEPIQCPKHDDAGPLSYLPENPAVGFERDTVCRHIARPCHDRMWLVAARGGTNSDLLNKERAKGLAIVATDDHPAAPHLRLRQDVRPAGAAVLAQRRRVEIASATAGP